MEKKTQLYFQDDNKFIFRKLPLKYSCLLEMAGKDTFKRGWRHSYAGQYSFPGYKNISADTVTLGFARDIFLDPHNKIPVGEGVSNKPKVDSIRQWIAKIAEDQRHVYRSKRESSGMNDYINWLLMAIAVVEILAWIIRFATRT